MGKDPTHLKFKVLLEDLKKLVFLENKVIATSLGDKSQRYHGGYCVGPSRIL
jgi:hypothetical protein